MKHILSLALCVLLLFSVVGCSAPQDSPAESTQDGQPSVGYEEQKAVYDEVIAQYTRLLTLKQNGEALPLPNTADMSRREADISETLYGIVNGCKDATAAKGLGYGYKDLDGNGTPELILLTKYASIRAILTISSEEPILLEAAYESGDVLLLATGNRFFMARDSVTDGIEEATFYTCRVSGDQTVYDAIYGKVYDQSKRKTLEIFQILNGNRVSVSEDAFDDLYYEYKQTTVPGYTTTAKLLAPRIYFPLGDTAAGENLPVADFSSYAAIRETYAKIATCLDQFDSMRFSVGGYDDLFTFPNDLSFEYYIRLLYTAYHGAYGSGYDEIDLNGDGLDELVLMNEDYRIKAIFTQKDQAPILLDAFAYEACWLDDEGFIHVDNEQYDKLEYSLYEFTSGGEYGLVYSLLLTNNGVRYLTKDGKTERIELEQSSQLYDDYCRYTEPFVPNEQTRNASDLTYTPLFPSTEDTIGNAAGQLWHKYAKLEKTSDKESARSDSYVSFEGLPDTQMTVTLKYVFTYSYPDPEREHYYLDDSTESTLQVTVHNENGVLTFDENGIKGRIERGHDYLWLVIDESTDQRFPVGHHCYALYNADALIP